MTYDELIAKIGADDYSAPYPMGGTAEDRQQYRKNQYALNAQFRVDLESCYLLAELKVSQERLDLLYRLAWEEGHSESLRRVVEGYDELVDLLADDVRRV